MSKAKWEEIRLEALEVQVDLADFQALRASKINLDSNNREEVIYLMNSRNSLGDRVNKREEVKPRRRERT